MRIAPSANDLTPLWRLLLVRAGIVLVLAVAALPWPVTSVSALVILVSTIALVAGLVDAVISGRMQERVAGSWMLLPEAVFGIVLGGAVLLYPLVPLAAVGVLAALWMFSRGIMLATVARGVASDTMIRTVTTGWAVASILGPVFMVVHWGETSVMPVVYLLVAYALVWSALELAVGLHLRARAVA